MLAVSLSRRSLVVHRTSGGEPYDFDTGSVGHARLAHTVALTLFEMRPKAAGRTPRKNSSRQGTLRTTETNREEGNAPVGSSVELPGSGQGIFSVQVVGESYCQAALKAFGGDRRLRDEHVIFTAALVPDPKNEYDPDAIKLYISGGARVGYLSREDAAEYREVAKALLSRKAIGLCRARLIGGTAAKPSIGVALDLADPATLLAAITGAEQPF